MNNRIREITFKKMQPIGKIKLLVFIITFAFTVLPSYAQRVINLNDESVAAQVSLRRSAQQTTIPQEFLKEAKAARIFTINPALQRARSVNVGDIVNLQLFEGKSYTATISDKITDVNGTLALTLKLLDYPMGFAIITTSTDGKSLVNISIPELGQLFGSQYSINSNENYIIEIDESKITHPNLEDDIMPTPEEIEIFDENAENNTIQLRSTCSGPVYNTNTNDPVTIDVLVVYTPAVANSANGGINNVIATMIALGNTCMTNSQTGITLNLAYSAQVDYNETNDMSTSLNRLRNPSDGYMDNVHELRKQYNADLVQMLSTDAGGGLGNLLLNTSGNYIACFSVCNIANVSGYNSTYPTSVHEMGHNMGLGHGALQTSGASSGIFPYSQGWLWTGSQTNEYGNNQYVSVMSYPHGDYYPDGVYKKRVPYFSNPNVNHLGSATGNSTQADAARSLREMKHVIAYYSDKLGSLPDAPTNIQVTNPTDHGATFSWNACANAVKYKVCRPTSNGSSSYYSTETTNTTHTFSNSTFLFPNTCTNYEMFIIAENACGDQVRSQTFTFNTSGLACQNSNDANLASLTVSEGTLSPTFNANTTNYTVSVGNSVTTINISATASNTNATVAGTGSKALNVGQNSFDIVVTAQDGTTTKTYNIIVTRAPISVTGVSLDKTNVSLTVGQNEQLAATISPSNAANQTVTWSSSNTNVATVSSTGMIAAIAAGSATITVTTQDGNQQATCTVSVTQSHTINVSADPSSGGTVSGDGAYVYGSSCTVDATANSGYTFISWTESGSVVSTDASYTFAVTSNRNLVANFDALTYTITATAGSNGDISPSGSITVNYGGSQRFDFTPNSGYEIDQVLVDGAVNSTAKADGYYTFSNVTSDHSISVTFAQIPPSTYTINVSADPSAGGTVSGDGVYAYGSSCTVAATANSGYTFTSWTESGSVVSTDASYTFAVTSSRNLVANFDALTYTITATAGSNGSISPSGAITVNYGSSQTFDFTPNYGYEIEQVLVDGAVNSTAKADGYYTFSNVTSDHSISVTFAQIPPSTYTINVSADPSAGGTVSGGGAYAYGSSCAVEAIANSGYTFTSWTESGSVVSTNASYTFAVTSSRNLVANFDALTYAITATAGSNGSISPSGSITANYGSSRRFDFTPNYGYEIEQVLVDGVVNSAAKADGYYTFSNVTSDHSIYVTFAQIPPSTYTINVSADPSAGGTVSGDGVYAYGSSCTVTATANSGYTFTSWTESGYVVSTNASYTFTVASNRNLVANFDALTYTITATAGSNGGISPSGSITVNYGSSRRFDFTPNYGYEIDQVLVDGAVNSTAKTNGYHTFYNITANHTISVTFKQSTPPPVDYTISVSANPSAGGTVSGGGVYASGASRIVTATANSGYTFTNWTESGYVVSTNASYTFAVTSNRNLVANFSPVTFTITATAESNGIISPSGTQTVAYGSSTKFDFAPNSGYEINQVLVDGAVNSTAKANGYHTFYNITANHNISVTFKASSNGIEDVETTGISVYPNPVKDEIFIKSALPINKVEIYSLSGTLLLSESGFNEKLSVSTLRRGVYLLKVHTNKGAEISKIVKK